VDPLDVALSAAVARRLMPAGRGMPIDIVIPVYNAAPELARCVDSVLAHSSGDWRLLLIDDASPAIAIRTYFSGLYARRLPQLKLLVNERNLGFVLTANRGMREARAHADLVLLNSNTIVTRGWLDKLARCAASDPRIGTITPFSNNAEICSLPRFCVDNPWPATQDAEPLVTALELAAVPTYPDLPTGVGFCLYMRRALIDAIGGFDPAFGLGYGEENDLCQRAIAAGYRNVLCEDAFVLHFGGSSFGDKRAELAERNLALLLERHPDYNDLVHSYIAADPLRPLRELALSQQRVLTGTRYGILHVLHGHGGGTEYHVRALVAASAGAFRHYLLIAAGKDWRLEEPVEGGVTGYDFRITDDESWSDLIGGLAARFGIDLIHLHNISGCREAMVTALAALRIPYGYTVHDLNFACPTITFLAADGRYCHGVTDIATCNACLGAQSEFADIDIGAWRARHRALLERAAFLIAPSQWTATMLRSYFPEHTVAVIPHGSGTGAPREDAVYTRVDLPDDGVPTVAVVGAIGQDKGSHRLDRLVELTRQRGARLRWVVIGYSDRGREQKQSEDAVFTQHGPFDSREIGLLLAHYRAHLVVYPSAGPETFSYTLSEAWAAGIPAVVPPIGALAERMAATGGGWVLHDSEWQDEARMLDRILALLDPTARDQWAAAAARAKAAAQPTIAAMAEATIAVWRDALAAAVLVRPPQTIAAKRCLEALRYVPWHPPAPAAPPKANGEDLLASVARAALAIRHTLPGRLLYRLTPRSLVDALKQRL
jgi:GT2 family glycosyltransferase/glycosyltransferase involved in cell wall biosynthesis